VKVVRAFLFVLGLVTFAIGVLYVFAPRIFTDQMGFGDLAPEAWTDLRATYGGLQIAIGGFAMWASASPSRYRPGLVMASMVLPALAVSRAIGLVIDGNATGLLLAILVFEIALSAASWLLLSRLGRT
jgi:hypothetical protein